MPITLIHGKDGGSLCLEMKPLIVFLTIVLRAAPGDTGEVFGSADPLEALFDKLAREHENVCQRSSTCKDSAISEEGSACCGTCSCETDCVRYGSCCLSGYDNFTHAKESMQNSRYSCLSAQYLPPPKTDYNDPDDLYYWMVNKCDPENSDITSRNLCETPGYVLEAVIPVTDPVSDVHYRNKFCAYCNGIDKTLPIIEWKFKIRSGEHLSFPMENFLQFIHRTRSNFFYVPPEYLNVQKCYPPPPFTIEMCNETGLWSVFDDAIEHACHSFLDPFNSTYKNYFCFLCNSPESVSTEDWICLLGSKYAPSFSVGESFYSTTLHPELIEQSKEHLNCGNKQFPDEAAMVCRDVFCRENHKLAHGKCTVSRYVTHENCFAMYIRLSVIRATIVTIHDNFDLSVFVGDLQYDLESALGIRNEMQIFQAFYHLGDNSRLEYVVVYVAFDFTDILKSDQILTSLFQMPDVEVLFHEIDVIFSLELTVYNMTLSDQEAKLLVPIGLNSFDTLHSSYRPDASRFSCSQKETVLINKLHFCPYIALGVDEIPHLSIIGNDLVSFVEAANDNQPLKLLTRWDYEIQDNKLYICLEDYFDIYQVIYTTKGDLKNESDYRKLLVHLYMISAYILCFHINKRVFHFHF